MTMTMISLAVTGPSGGGTCRRQGMGITLSAVEPTSPRFSQARQPSTFPSDRYRCAAPFMDFQSGYVLRALDRLPKQGDRTPWRLKQNYLTDLRTIRRGRIDDGVLAFDRVPAREVDLTDA